MDYLYLVLVVFGSAATGVLATFYKRRTSDKTDPTGLYIFLQLLFVLIFWGVLYLFDFSFEVRVLWYSVIFAVFYSMAVMGQVYALKWGPTSLTTLIMQISMIVTTLWGVLFWGSEWSVKIAVGLVLVGISLWLCLYSGAKGEEKKTSWKWLLFCLLAFIGNSGCTIAQRTQQMHFDGEHGKMLMFFASILSASAGLFLFLRSDKKDSKIILKTNAAIPAFSGAINVLSNFLVIVLASSTLSPNLIYPVISVGSLIITMLFSLFAFKEKLKWWQWLGVAIGILATGVLS